MINISISEKILYLIFIGVEIFGKLSNNINDYQIMYDFIKNINMFSMIYIPLYLYNVIPIIKIKKTIQVITRYRDFYEFEISILKSILLLSIRVSIVFNIVLFIFFILCDHSLLHTFGTYIFIFISIIIQSISWTLIGLIFNFVSIIIDNISLSYLISIGIFVVQMIIIKPLSYIYLPIYDIAIFNTMFFETINSDIMIMIRRMFINLITISILFVACTKAIKNKDILKR